MKNVEIINANNTLEELVDMPLKGKMKFKLFKNKVKLEEAMKLIVRSLEGVEDTEERKSILEESQEVPIDKFTEDELSDLDLTIKQIAGLQSIIEFEYGGEE